MPAREFKFRIGDAFPAANPVARFVAVLAVIYNDWRTGWVELRLAIVAVWEEGLIVRGTTYTDIAEARAAAERLAESRAQADV